MGIFFKKWVILLMLFISVPLFCQPVSAPFEPVYYSMNRQQIRFNDPQVLLFNYRGFVCPQQYSMTSFTNVQFLPMRAPYYTFNLNFLDNRTGKLIRDDVPEIWDNWVREGKGSDPLAANFRPYAPFMMVTQDEIWQPNEYFRAGTFHKELNGEWISFSLKSWMSVSNSNDEVFLKLIFRNRKDNPLNLTIIPQQIADFLYCDGAHGDPKVNKSKDAFTLSSEQMKAVVTSDIRDRNEKGFELTLLPGKEVTVYFAVQFYPSQQRSPDIYQENIRARMELADQFSREKLKWAYKTLPKLESSNKELQEYYYRCMLSVLMSRYENPNYITNPFWAVGYWPFTISWDTSYASDILAMLDPQSLKEAILTDFREGKMKRTYVSWKGAEWDNIYIQEPFALQIMIEAYLRHTGDIGLLNQMAGDATVWQWMLRWVGELKTNYTDSLGLMNVGYDTQKIIEIRTDGYNHVVPIFNLLTVNLLYRMAQWSEMLNDNKGTELFTEAEGLNILINNNLWNEDKGWYDNLYPDGSKETIWTFHMFDALGTGFLSEEQINKLASHIREGEFLGKFGLYSIARNDTVHWDLIDSDWGGGGQYAGMPGRISRNLYQQGFAESGWNVLRRNIRYINYFPYLPQNPRTDNPEQDQSSMPVSISAGAGMEAIIFGMFGIRIENEHLFISPAPNEDTEWATLRDFKFKGKLYTIQISQKSFSVYLDGKCLLTKPIGESVRL